MVLHHWVGLKAQAGQILPRLEAQVDAIEAVYRALVPGRAGECA